MKRLGRAFAAFWRTLRQKKADPGQLREFVYLDETSVESLLASLDGEILTGITSSRTRGSEFGIAATGDATGVPTGFAPSAKWSRSNSVQEHRKSVAQSTFARFRSRHYRSLKLRARDNGPDVIVGTPIPDVAKDLRLDQIHRGDLVEVDAFLGGSDVFQVQAVIEAMTDMVDSVPDLVPVNELAAIQGALPIANLLRRLSQGLIPIEGEIAGYRAADVKGVTWILREELADELAARGVVTKKIVIAGVSLAPLYWQDVRRILFSNQKYRVLGRLLHDGGHSSWSSVKITEILTRVNKEIAGTIDALGPMFLRTLQQSTGKNLVATSTREDGLQTQLVLYAVAYAEAFETKLDPERLSRVVASALDFSGDELGAVQWKRALVNVENQVVEECGQRLSPEASLELRGRFPVPAIRSVQAPVSGDSHPEKWAEGTLFLEVEVVAVYW